MTLCNYWGYVRKKTKIKSCSFSPPFVMLPLAGSQMPHKRVWLLSRLSSWGRIGIQVSCPNWSSQVNIHHQLSAMVAILISSPAELSYNCSAKWYLSRAMRQQSGAFPELKKSWANQNDYFQPCTLLWSNNQDREDINSWELQQWNGNCKRETGGCLVKWKA